MNTIFLIDCNNFYASCETIFNPQFKNKPLVVASGKNGIVVARSNEAKALGIPMAAASFAYRSLFIKEDVISRNPNFALYNDISKRIRCIVKAYCFHTFVYSIDEMFLQVPIDEDLEVIAQNIQAEIKRDTGIDVSIGISKTKTLAKIATKIAKKLPQNRMTLLDDDEIDGVLKDFDVGDIWGVGKKITKKLSQNKIRTASDLLNISEGLLGKLLGVCGKRIKRELLGENGYPFITKDPAKSMQITRTFPVEIYSIQRIKEILSEFASTGCYKLRKENQEASVFSLFLQSSRFKNNKTNIFKEHVLQEPSNYTPDFLSFIDDSLSEYVDGEIEVKRAGIAFSLLTSNSCTQKNLFCKDDPSKKDLLVSIDQINERFGKNTISFGSTSPKKEQQQNPTRSYTTKWDEILEIDI